MAVTLRAPDTTAVPPVRGNPISPVTIAAIVVLAFAIGARRYRRRRSRHP